MLIVARDNSLHFTTPPLVSPAKWSLRNKCRNYILMMCHYPDLGGACNWLKQISHVAWPIRSTTQVLVVMHHQYGISALVSQTSQFHMETSGGTMECCLLSQAMLIEESFNMSIDRIEKLPCLHNYINIAFCKIVRHNIVSQH